jgi:cytoskeletal protein RodZ
MEQLGVYLKRQRELRQVDIHDISDETKIAVNWLQVIEEDMWKELPGRVFARGYAKAYAKALGLDLDEVLNRYDHMYAQEENVEIGNEIVSLTKKRSARLKSLIPIAILLVIVVVGLVIWLV